MKKKILLIVFLSMLFGGVVSAASLWGTFKGNQVIRLSVDGVPVKVSDVPAILYNGRTMIPIYLLQQAGIEYEWDATNQTVNIFSNGTPPPAEETSIRKALTAKEISKLMDRVGLVEAYDSNGNLQGTGSGFLLDGGWFVTNSHVGHNNFLKVTVGDKTYDTKGWFWFDNATTDVYGTVLSTSYSADGNITGEIPTRGLPFTTTLPEVGDKVYMIGSPLGVVNTLSEGIVSGVRQNAGVTYIQHTAATEGGSSGGALLNEYGEVIGLHSFVLPDGDSVKFAIPMMYVNSEINAVLKQ